MKSNLHTHFKCLKDPRINRKKLHSLQDIISLVVIGIICGADSWDAIEEFGKAKKDFLSTFLTLQNGNEQSELAKQFHRMILLTESSVLLTPKNLN